MRVGISLTSSHRTRDVRAGARWMIERTEAAAEAGLDSLFVGDHHVEGMPYYQNNPMMGRLLAEWNGNPAGCLFLIPLWHPVLLAEQVGTLASITPGRFIIQCGLGRDKRQFEGMGVDIRHRPSRFEQGLDIVRRLLAGETVSSDGRYKIIEARISPIPPELVDVWIGGGVEPAIDRAARLGDAYLAGPESTPDSAAKLSATFHQRRIDHGLPPAPAALRRDVFVGESDAHAAKIAEPIVDAGYRGFDPAAPIFGSPETVAKKFRALATMGYSDIIIRHLTDDHELVLGSLARLKEVRNLVVDA